MTDYTDADLERVRSWLRSHALEGEGSAEHYDDVEPQALASLIASVREEGRRAGLEEAYARVFDIRMRIGEKRDSAQSESRKEYLTDRMVGLQDAELAIRALADKPATGDVGL